MGLFKHIKDFLRKCVPVVAVIKYEFVHVKKNLQKLYKRSNQIRCINSGSGSDLAKKFRIRLDPDPRHCSKAIICP
jgi:hypothetical protein